MNKMFAFPLQSCIIKRWHITEISQVWFIHYRVVYKFIIYRFSEKNVSTFFRYSLVSVFTEVVIHQKQVNWYPVRLANVVCFATERVPVWVAFWVRRQVEFSVNIEDRVNPGAKKKSTKHEKYSSANTIQCTKTKNICLTVINKINVFMWPVRRQKERTRTCIYRKTRPREREFNDN